VEEHVLSDIEVLPSAQLQGLASSKPAKTKIGPSGPEVDRQTTFGSLGSGALRVMLLSCPVIPVKDWPNPVFFAWVQTKEALIIAPPQPVPVGLEIWQRERRGLAQHDHASDV
jgi:hypothetical protein